MGVLPSHFPLKGDPPHDEGGDAELVARARRGDAGALSLLYRRHVDRVYDFAARRLGQREDAEDATQTVFLRVAQSLHQCRSDDAFTGWLFAIARNVVTDMLRSRRTRTMSLDEEPEIEDPDPPPDDVVVRSAQGSELRMARAHCLNETERELYDLLVQDLTYAEIATVLGRRVGAVRTRCWRLLDKLRSCMGLLPKGGRHALQ